MKFRGRTTQTGRNVGVVYPSGPAPMAPHHHHQLSVMLLNRWCIAVASLLVALLVVVPLDSHEHITGRRGSILFICGFTFFYTLYTGLNDVCMGTVYGRTICRRYGLTLADVLDTNNKIVSAVQALFCCATGAICVWHSCLFGDMMRTSHYMSEAYAWFGAAYFLYDIISMYDAHATGESNTRSAASTLVVWREFLASNVIIVAHHIFIGAFGFLVMTVFRGRLGDCYFAFIYLMEASTPLVSLRGILATLHLKHTRLYIANGLLMLGVFLLCRILMFPFVIYLYSRTVHLNYFAAIESLPRGCKISILLLLLPQLYWFHLMVRGALKVFRRPPSPPQS